MPLASNAKQAIYQLMLMKIADFRHLGFIDAMNAADREFISELECQADLLHGIPRAIADVSICDDDVVFLNRHAKRYLSVAGSGWVNRSFFNVMIYQRFVLVASERSEELEWAGPTLTSEERLTIAAEQ